MEELSTLSDLPTLKDVYGAYYWRQNELKDGKGLNYKPTQTEVAKLVMQDILRTWTYASLERNVVTSQGILKKIKKSIDDLAKLNRTPSNRPGYLSQVNKLEENKNKVFDIA